MLSIPLAIWIYDSHIWSLYECKILSGVLIFVAILILLGHIHHRLGHHQSDHGAILLVIAGRSSS